MPGVPSGRGCDACRKQKKKCDQAKPQCSRCARLDLECSGAGVQRYKFKLVSQPDELLLERFSNARETFPFRTPSPVTLQQNYLDRLIIDFSRTIEPTTDIRYNMLWTYGAYFADIPRRLGTNKALDASVRALTTLHSGHCSRTKALLPHGLSEYTTALSCLRKCLEDPTIARTAETLCAVSLLVICQSFLGGSSDQDGSHTRGAAQVLKTRGYFDCEDPFESSLLLALRGPVLVGSLFTDDVGFTTEEWQRIILNPLDGQTFEGRLMLCLANAPALVKRARQWTIDNPDFQLAEEVQDGYMEIKTILSELRARRHLAGNPHVLGAPDLHSDGLGVVLYERAYCFGLAIAFIYNSLVSFATDELVKLQMEANGFASELLDFVPSARRYRPLGGAYMALCLRVALISEVDSVMKSRIYQHSIEFEDGFVTKDQRWSPDDHQDQCCRMLDPALRSNKFRAPQVWRS